MIDSKSSFSSIGQDDEIERQYDDLIREYDSFQDKVKTQAKNLKASKIQTMQKLSAERSKLMMERQRLEEDKEIWRKEKMKIDQIQPLEDIVDINVGGKDDFSIRKSTLCHVKGSALEAMFSGRHQLQKKQERVFIDRNPLAFSLMIDFIRNSGQLHEAQKNNQEMLKMELNYWGIDDRLFQKPKRDNFEIIESLLGEPILDFFDQREGSEFFFKNLGQSTLNFS